MPDLNVRMRKEALYAENRFHRATRGVIVASFLQPPDFEDLARAHRSFVAQPRFGNDLNAYDRLVEKLRSNH